jgi:hypothetical protein
MKVPCLSEEEKEKNQVGKGGLEKGKQFKIVGREWEMGEWEAEAKGKRKGTGTQTGDSLESRDSAAE